MADLVKCLAKVQNDNVNLCTSNNLLELILNKLYELRYARALLKEIMLQFTQVLVLVEMPGNDRRYNKLHNLAQYAGERNRSIISWVACVSLFEKWTYPSFRPITGKYFCKQRCYFMP